MNYKIGVAIKPTSGLYAEQEFEAVVKDISDIEGTCDSIRDSILDSMYGLTKEEVETWFEQLPEEVPE